jgi:hypothetical protein
VLRVSAVLPRSAAADLGRRAWQVDADRPLGPTRRGLAAGAGFEMSWCVRGMGKERPGEMVRGPERRGTGTGTRRRGAASASLRPC